VKLRKSKSPNMYRVCSVRNTAVGMSFLCARQTNKEWTRMSHIWYLIVNNWTQHVSFTGPKDKPLL